MYPSSISRNWSPGSWGGPTLAPDRIREEDEALAVASTAQSGMSYSVGNALNRTLKYTLKGTTLNNSVKPTSVLFKLPVGNAYVPLKTVKVASAGLKVLGSALGVYSVVDHGNKAIDAYNSGNWSSAVINTGKVIIDVALMMAKSTNPVALGASVAYGVADYYTNDY